MRTIPILPEHRAELRFLLGDVYHLQRLQAHPREISKAMRRLGDRHLALYPQLTGKQVALSEDMETQDVYDSAEEWAQAIAAQAARERETPYVAFTGIPGRPVMGPKT
jgi:hypothetical protein